MRLRTKALAQATRLRSATLATGLLRVASAVLDGETVTIGSKVFEVDTDGNITAGRVRVNCDVGTAVAAAISFEATANPTNGETVTLGSKVYTFKTTLTAAANDVLIGANAEASYNNLVAAITGGAGSGTTYSAATVASTQVTAVEGTDVAATSILTLAENAADTNTVTIGGVVYTLQDTLTNVAGNVKIGASASATIDNLIAAIMLGAGSGTSYAAATVVHPTVTAAVGDGDTMGVTARTAGAAGNLIGTTDTLAGASAFTSTVLAGGKDVITVTALVKGTAGNSLASTETLAAGAFADTTLNLGVDPTAAEFTTALVAAINDDDGPVFAYRYSDNIVVVNDRRPPRGRSLATTETLSGANNAWAAATLTASLVPDDALNVVRISRVPTALEVTLQVMFFPLNFTPTEADVTVKSSVGVYTSWDGAITIEGNIVRVISSGSADITTDDIVTVTAS